MSEICDSHKAKPHEVESFVDVLHLLQDWFTYQPKCKPSQPVHRAPEPQTPLAKHFSPAQVQDIKTTIRTFEGTKDHVYRDSRSIKTIGVGFNLEADGARQKLSSVGANYDRVVNGQENLHPRQIDRLLDVKLNEAVVDAHRLFPKLDHYPYKVKRTLIDLTYNMGADTLSDFKKMIDHVEHGQFRAAGAALKHSRYYHQVGNERGEFNVRSLQEADRPKSHSGLGI